MGLHTNQRRTKNDIFSIVLSGVSWRWVYWVMMIFAGACTVITALFLPETFAPVLLLRRVRRTGFPA